MTGLLFNSDGGSGALYAFEPPISSEQLCRVVNSLEGTQVDTFIQCVSDGSFVAYGTQVGEIYGKNMTEFENENFRRWSQNILGLLDAGKDPLDIWSARTHGLGMQFWAGLRMNDIHKDWVDRWPSLRTQWELERPHVAIGKDMPDRYKNRYPDNSFTWAFDFTQQEVRDLKFGLIEEICLNYDVDGFEMDFLSHPMYFRRNEEITGMPLLTGFVRRIRDRMDEIGRQKGRKLTLCARVLPSIALCEEIGLDVRTWIEEGLVDILAPSTRGYLDVSADIRNFVSLAEGSTCIIAGGITDLWVRHYEGRNPPRASIEMMRAAAASLWHQGVSRIHVFNYDCHATGIQHHNTVDTLIDTEAAPLFSREEYSILTEIGEPGTVEGKDKHYCVTRDMNDRTSQEGGDMQLPADITKDKGAETFQLILGDDMENAARQEALKDVELIVTLTAHGKSSIELVLNGKSVEYRRERATLFCEDPPVRQGLNQLEIGVKDGPVRVEGIELKILYR